ncbi:MAG TPA: VacB/RNase II family 3'-5' exoribonuclease [Stellaceae bacterium]|nr:VacB/RNase II family 3'-5' exoribonuclease [Stellaceae bacterium]
MRRGRVPGPQARWRQRSAPRDARPARRSAAPSATRIVGVFRQFRTGGVVVPVDRRDRIEYAVAAREAETLADGELVVAVEITSARFGPPQVHIVERLGPAEAPGAFSLLSIAAFEIPTEFPEDALAEAEKAPPLTLAGREDLRGIALVTIDGPDARDFDDAVWAESDPDPANSGGWHIVVAIADVAWYVRPGGELDREATRRGNSVYFPDRVVPMLPEALSNGLCSLVPGEDRACLVAEMWVDRDGRKRRHRFARALMRSAARLTYEAVQAARDGSGSIALTPERLSALYDAWAALDRAREARGALALDLREDRVVLDPGGRPMAIVPQPRLDSHRLIEEFMILANVAAAEELEARRQPCVYRVHDLPDPDKVEALREFLDEMGVPGLKLVKGERLRPELFNRLLARAAGSAEAPLVNDLVLRAQAQAVYSTRNIGHFGLALARYAHFTSPIRRYADLLVHRALLGETTLPPDELTAAAEHISATERRAVAAERAALDRYRTALLAGAVDTVFEARITGVARFGLFVTVADGSGDGLLPIATLPGDYYRHDERRHRLVGSRTRRIFALGDAVTVRLVEADPAGGRLLFRFEDSTSAPPSKPSPQAAARRGRTRRR